MIGRTGLLGRRCSITAAHHVSHDGTLMYRFQVSYFSRNIFHNCKHIMSPMMEHLCTDSRYILTYQEYVPYLQYIMSPMMEHLCADSRYILVFQKYVPYIQHILSPMMELLCTDSWYIIVPWNMFHMFSTSCLP